MGLGDAGYWKRVNDDGTVRSVYRRLWNDEGVRMERFTSHGYWSDAADYFFTVLEDPDFIEITEAEADELIPIIAAQPD